MTVQHARSVEAAEDSWFANIKSITNVHVSPPFPAHDQFPRHVRVQVSFDLVQDHDERAITSGAAHCWSSTTDASATMTGISHPSRACHVSGRTTSA